MRGSRADVAGPAPPQSPEGGGELWGSVTTGWNGNHEPPTDTDTGRDGEGIAGLCWRWHRLAWQYKGPKQRRSGLGNSQAAGPRMVLHHCRVSGTTAWETERKLALTNQRQQQRKDFREMSTQAPAVLQRLPGNGTNRW